MTAPRPSAFTTPAACAGMPNAWLERACAAVTASASALARTAATWNAAPVSVAPARSASNAAFASAAPLTESPMPTFSCSSATSVSGPVAKERRKFRFLYLLGPRRHLDHVREPREEPLLLVLCALIGDERDEPLAHRPREDLCYAVVVVAGESADDGVPCSASEGAAAELVLGSLLVGLSAAAGLGIELGEIPNDPSPATKKPTSDSATSCWSAVIEALLVARANRCALATADCFVHCCPTSTSTPASQSKVRSER